MVSTCPQIVAFVRREWDGASVWLSRGFVGSSSALRPRSRRFRIRSFRLPQSSLPTSTPQFSLLLSLLQRCYGSAAGQQRPLVSVSAGPVGAARNHNPTRTAIIFVCVDSFIRWLTAKHQMLIPFLVPRSHAHDTTHSSGHSLSSLVTGWLLQQERLSNPSGLRWSPHLLPISHTHHSNLESL